MARRPRKKPVDFDGNPDHVTLGIVYGKKGKGKGSSLDTAPLTILDSGALQPRK